MGCKRPILLREPLRKKRTPRNYSGIQNPAKKISDLLPEFLSEMRGKSALTKEEVFPFWEELLGKEMALLTEFTSLKDGVLTVKVKSSTLYSLLATHEKRRLLGRLKEKFPIRNLIFRVG